jgi:hypothetical protein
MIVKSIGHILHLVPEIYHTKRNKEYHTFRDITVDYKKNLKNKWEKQKKIFLKEKTCN